MKKILFVINTLGLAGAEKALIELLRSIDPKKYRIDLFVLLNQGELIGEIPDYVNILNSDFDACPIHTAEGQRHLLGRSIKAVLLRASSSDLFLIASTFTILWNTLTMDAFSG